MSGVTMHEPNGEAIDATVPPSLPSGWCWTTVAELADVGTGTTPGRTNSKYWEGGTILWVTSTAVNELTVSEGNEFITESAVAETTLRVYPKHTLILALYGEGKTRGKVSELLLDATINQALAALVLRGEASEVRRYLKVFLLSNYVQMRRQAAGGMQPNLNLSIVKRIPVPLAPLNEQRRIVGKIEELFSDLEAGVAALTRARANLKRYRASVLKAAVEGALTAEWRTQHPQVEPASKLLERLLTERRRQWEADQLTKFAAAGKQPPNNWQAKYFEPTPLNTTNLATLPEGWCWASVGRLLIEPTCNGISIKGRNEPPGVPALRLNAMTESGFNYSARRYIDISDELANDLAIRLADFFVSRGNGSLHLVGRGTLAQEPGERVVFPDTMIRLRIAEPPVLPRFIGVIWASRLLRRQIETTARTTAGIYKISQADVESFVVPLPPLAEQAEIVATVSEKLSQIESAEVAIEHSLRRAARLRQSILKQAFEGKLVPQDPTDEPASSSLERINRSIRSIAPARPLRGSARVS